MVLRLLLALLFFNYVLLAESKIDTKIEAGIYMPTLNGSINNHQSSSDISKDYGFTNTTASYLSLLLLLDYPYIPNLSIDYFYMQENEDTVLNKTVAVADGTFSSSISSKIDYNVLNAVFFQDFKKKGSFFSLFGKRYYTGDLEFDVGINTKYISWKFEIQDKTNLNQSPSWIYVNEFIALPYLGFKYYLYNLSIYSNISALSLMDAKSMNYQIALSYRVINGLYLNGAYIHEEFKAIEKSDTVEFNTSGYKFSFIYAF